jgi:hypothetical protein
MFDFLHNFMRTVNTPVRDTRLAEPASEAGVDAAANEEEVSYEHLLPYLMLPLISTF